MSSLFPNVRRHFLTWDRPWLQQAVSWLARDWRDGPLDLAHLLVVVPTQQAGRRLREALAEFAATRRTAVFPPRVLTPDALTRQDLGADVASPLEALLAWVAVLRSIDLNEFREVFPIDPPVRSVPWALRLGQGFIRLQVKLADAGLHLSDVNRMAGDDFVERKRWRQIAELERLHASDLAREGKRDPQAARIQAASEPAFEGGFERLVLLAVPDLSPLARQRIARFATGEVEVIIFANVEEAANFDEWGTPVTAHWERRVIALPDFEARVHLFADPATQASKVADLAVQYKGAPGGLAVGIADPEITPVLENDLRRRDEPVFNPDGRVMRREGLFTLLNGLAELVREASFAAVDALSRCPEFLRWLQNKHTGFSAARWLESLDELRSEHLPPDLEAANWFAVRSRDSVELVQGLQAMEEVRTLLRARPFASGATEVLRRIYGHRGLDLSHASDAIFEEAAQAWMEVVRECAAIEGKFTRLTITETWEIALRIFAEQRIGEDKPAHALELQGWLELAWEDAPHLVIAGMNDGRVPESVPDDPFLPGSLRRRLGLTTDATRFARDAYLLQAIVASRRSEGRVDLLFGKTSTVGEPLRPSRLLLRCDDAELPQRIEMLFRAPAVPNGNPSWTRAWKLTPRIAPPPSRVAVTALRRYLSCPFRFYLRHVLRMESVDPFKNELDAFDFGTLCHGALERIGSDPALRECTDAGVLRSQLLHQLEAAVLGRYGKHHSLPLMVQVESARQRLSKLAELQAIERTAGWEIVQVEKSFELEISGLIVRGKIDRIDRNTETGAIRVLDYKTSDEPVNPIDAHLRSIRSSEELPDWARVECDGRLRGWADLQLPLYRQALMAEFPGEIICGYFNLPKATGETTLALWENYTSDLHASALRCAESVCAAIRAAKFWPPNESLRAERDEWAALFHHGVGESVAWPRP